MGSTCILKRNMLVTYTPLTIWTTVSQDLLSRSVGFERCLNDWWSLQPLYPYLYRSPGLPSSSTFSWRPQNGPCTIQNPVWGEDISVKQVTEMYYVFLFINTLYHLFFYFELNIIYDFMDKPTYWKLVNSILVYSVLNYDY